MGKYFSPACLADIPGYLETLICSGSDIEEKRREFEATKPEITRLARGDLASNEANSRSAMIEGALEAVGKYLEEGERTALEKAHNVLKNMREDPSVWNF